MGKKETVDESDHEISIKSSVWQIVCSGTVVISASYCRKRFQVCPERFKNVGRNI